MRVRSKRWGRWGLLLAVGVAAALPGKAAVDRADRALSPLVETVVARSDGEPEAALHVVVDESREPRLRFFTGEGGGFELPLAGGGFLGVELVDLTPELRSHFGVPEDAGVMIGRVVDDSPAWRAGLRVGDVISGVAGVTVGTARDLAREVRGRGGETAVLEVWRDGAVEQIDVTLEAREGSWSALASPFGDGDFHRLMERYGLSCEGEHCGVMIRCGDEGPCECEVNGERRQCGEVEGGDGE